MNRRKLFWTIIKLCDWVIEFKCKIRNSYFIWDLISEQYNLSKKYFYHGNLYKYVLLILFA